MIICENVIYKDKSSVAANTTPHDFEFVNLNKLPEITLQSIRVFPTFILILILATSLMPNEKSIFFIGD